MATLKFPENFIWGTATASYQVEGAITEDGGRGPSIWDMFVREPNAIEDNSTADVTTDSYHKYMDDIKLMKELGTNAYRFSIAWPRIMPAGRGAVNPAGIKYYHNLIDALIANGITPIVTLYHWDLPQALQDRGGWLTSDILDVFEEYARVCFSEFGSKVSYWITLNEPRVHAWAGHSSHAFVRHAPGIESNGDWAHYLAMHNLLRAHLTAYRLYDKEFRPQFHGKVGITNLFVWAQPADWDLSDDLEAAARYNDMGFGAYTDPFIFGDYPDRLKEQLWKLSQSTGRVESILPEFTAEEKKELKGALDFIGLNYYFSLEAKPCTGLETEMNWADIDWNVYATMNKDWEMVGMEPKWINNYPAGFYRAIMHLKDKYKDFPILITENGCMDSPDEGLSDVTRVKYLNGHIAATALALKSGANLLGYIAWSLMDNFEWSKGYTNLFGLHHVDFQDPEKKRIPKLSAKWYKDVIKQNEITLPSDLAKNIARSGETTESTDTNTQPVPTPLPSVAISASNAMHRA